jgi:hypothetical protein
MSAYHEHDTGRGRRTWVVLAGLVLAIVAAVIIVLAATGGGGGSGGGY